MDFASISAPSKFLHSRLDHVSEKIASLSLDLALAKTATDANPDSADKKAYHHALQKQLEALNDEKEFLKKFRDSYPEQLQSLNTSFNTNPGAVVKLKPPKAYKIGDDFEILFELFQSFASSEPYSRQVQILKTLLSPEAFKVCKHVLNEALTLSHLESELKLVFTKSTNQTSAIHVQ